MLADTGAFGVPIECLTRKAKMVISTPLVDFGPGVTLAESASQTFTISNEGALDVEYTISVDDRVSEKSVWRRWMTRWVRGVDERGGEG
jgi:hypothetical protein